MLVTCGARVTPNQSPKVCLRTAPYPHHHKSLELHGAAITLPGSSSGVFWIPATPGRHGLGKHSRPQALLLQLAPAVCPVASGHLLAIFRPEMGRRSWAGRIHSSKDTLHFIHFQPQSPSWRRGRKGSFGRQPCTCNSPNSRCSWSVLFPLLRKGLAETSREALCPWRHKGSRERRLVSFTSPSKEDGRSEVLSPFLRASASCQEPSGPAQVPATSHHLTELCQEAALAAG